MSGNSFDRKLKKVMYTLALVAVIGSIGLVGYKYANQTNTVAPPNSDQLIKLQTQIYAFSKGIDSTVVKKFEKWVRQYRKFYFNKEETNYRLGVFAENYKFIEDSNARKLNYTLAINEFADLTNTEFGDRFLCKNMQEQLKMRNSQMSTAVRKTPLSEDASKDWEKAGDVTKVKNQGSCGSCWAFSAIGALESLYAITHNNTKQEFSEQQLVDCSRDAKYGNLGCGGGWMDAGFQYLIDNGGACTEEDYPYTGTDGTCKKCTPKFTFSKFTDVPKNDEAQLVAYADEQPIAVAVNANYAWQFYFGGVMDPWLGCGPTPNHGVLLVGFGEDGGKKFLKIKNSWGSGWGESGYVRLARGTSKKEGVCGVNTNPSIPVA